MMVCKRLKRRIYVNTQDDYFVQCVSPSLLRIKYFANWNKQRVTECTELNEVAKKFIQANCYLPPVPGLRMLEC